MFPLWCGFRPKTYLLWAPVPQGKHHLKTLKIRDIFILSAQELPDPGRLELKPAIFYRTATVLLLLFAALHTFGFQQVDPTWGVDSLIGSMRSVHFDMMGSNRTYWDLFVGFGLLFSVFLVFTAVLAWQLSGAPAQTLALLRGTAWALVICFAAVAGVSLIYTFIIPTVFSILIMLCFAAAAWLSTKRV